MTTPDTNSDYTLDRKTALRQVFDNGFAAGESAERRRWLDDSREVFTATSASDLPETGGLTFLDIMPIEDLQLNVLPLNALRRASVHTVEVLVELPVGQLFDILEFDLEAVSEVITALEPHVQRLAKN